MLRIKDNVDLKELKKYGFSPLYDRFTGKLEEMYYTFRYSDKKIVVKKYQNKIEKKTFIFQKNNGIKERKGYYLFAFMDCGYVNEFADVIYDLIQADLIEKVEE